MKMTRETLIENIEMLKRRFTGLYPDVSDSDLQCRIWVHIAEARLTLKLQNHVDDEWIERACDSLFRAYEEIREINRNSKYKYFTDRTFILKTE